MVAHRCTASTAFPFSVFVSTAVVVAGADDRTAAVIVFEVVGTDLEVEAIGFEDMGVRTGSALSRSVDGIRQVRQQNGMKDKVSRTNKTSNTKSQTRNLLAEMNKKIGHRRNR